ncbi:putative Pyoverdine biosynthesis protein PvcA [Vibrio nigripulchritudo MADA3029]|uniref:L-tyrosine/L-tryptophan isonitrile synthase family protein n=1 Tax=Vibrio nigripulchritudo TaxID=28173 RepID=UPI0003B17C97|nr:L-tyrosine/L-tryptophan isonitrile synthase family protein [Vibrio nigripulchritudo]CCN47814.1 putative Pyoverdine biosynthesis protein PvcA [Vibrio nigripulchritudo MADA3020]CCN55673.1 putative Pyoverdine biosynthesis protein PvcA [Vibrio nigripulchritudo MADA3021]CCN62415.1 putative Pyoverdine biosynthesis protein PvcA [Vibrio nigripulchritudo MADA3029]
MLDIQREQCVENISFILLNQLLAQTDASFQGLVKLKQQIRDYVANDGQIKLLLPAFPCKTNNLDKVLGHKPDMGEYLVLRKFVKAIRDIQAVYKPGVTFYIFSDYHTFSDYISVDLEHHYEYSDELRKMVESMNCSDYLKIVNFEHFEAFDGLTDDQYFRGLKDKFGDPSYEQNFAELKLRNNKMNNTYLGLKKFMNQDQKHVLSKYSYKSRRQRLAEIAKGMMVQGKALDSFLQAHFGDCIRLSIHEHPMVGKKYSLFLFEEKQFKTPWHSTMMFDSTTGKFVVDSREKHLNSRGVIIPVMHQERAWCYLKLTARTEEMAHQLKQLSATLYHEKSGLVLESNTADLPVSSLNQKELRHLMKEFGTVTLRGFNEFSEPTEMENWYCERGSAVPWQFGQVQIMASQHTEHAALPLHWNLMCPPSYMGVNQDKYCYEDYTPDEFILYCRCHSNQQHDGVSAIISVDAALAAISVHGFEREALRNTSLRYSPQTQHPEPESMVYPLVTQCPWSKQDVVRWAQSEGEHAQSEILFSINAEIVASPTYDQVAPLENRMNQICGDERLQTRHQIQEGDLLLVNNHSTLMGAEPFIGKRELWRMQLQPKSVNSPWQPHNMAEFNRAS